MADGLCDLGSCAFALNARGADNEVRGGMSPSQYLQNISQCCAVQGGGDANLSGQKGERSLALGCKQPLVFESAFELVEGDLERPLSVGLHVFADDLIFAFWFVDRDSSTSDDAEANGTVNPYYLRVPLPKAREVVTEEEEQNKEAENRLIWWR